VRELRMETSDLLLLDSMCERTFTIAPVVAGRPEPSTLGSPWAYILCRYSRETKIASQAPKSLVVVVPKFYQDAKGPRGPMTHPRHHAESSVPHDSADLASHLVTDEWLTGRVQQLILTGPPNGAALPGKMVLALAALPIVRPPNATGAS